MHNKAVNIKFLCLLASLIYSGECKKFQIVGGHAAHIIDTPFQVIFYTNGDLVCSGSLITPLFVLTAAHCTYYFPSKITLRLGSSYRSREGIVTDVVKFISHPNFDPKTYDFDFCMLKLGAPVKYSRFIQPTKLPNPGESIPVGTRCRISGWGLQTFNDIEDPPEQMLAANIEIVDFQNCSSNYSNVQQELTDRMLCASVTGANHDSCLGDSGGPLVCNNKLYGVISFGFGCGTQGFPGIYSKVSLVIPWIRKVIQSD